MATLPDIAHRPWLLPLEEDAKDALAAASDIASYEKAAEVEPLHVLLGVMRAPVGAVRLALDSLGIPPTRLCPRPSLQKEPFWEGTRPFLAPPGVHVLQCAESHGRCRAPAKIGAAELLLGLIDAQPLLFLWLLERREAVLDLRHELCDDSGVDAALLGVSAGPSETSVASAIAGLSEPARRAMQDAREEARLRGDSYVGAEHLLLALCRPGAGGAAAAIEVVFTQPERVRAELVRRLGPPREAPREAPSGLSPDVEEILGIARNEARRMGHGQVGTEALLMGLLWQRKSVAAEVLSALEVSLHRARIALSRVYDAPAVPAPTTAERAANSARWRVLTLRLHAVMEEASRLASGWGHSEVEPLHLLAALADQQGGLAPLALHLQGVHCDDVLGELRRTRPLGTLRPSDALPQLTDVVRKTLGMATDWTRARGLSRRGTDGLLAAMLAQPDLPATAWLLSRVASADALLSAMDRPAPKELSEPASSR